VSASKSRHHGPGYGEMRRRSRRLTLQALYQWQLAGSQVIQIEAEFLTDNDQDKFDKVYFRELLQGITNQSEELDACIEPTLDRPLKELDPIEMALLRLGCFELKESLDVPYRVVINEAVELAKKFGGTDGHKFVNSVLDKLSLRFRSTERADREIKPKNE